jgi:hypothetical protein
MTQKRILTLINILTISGMLLLPIATLGVERADPSELLGGVGREAGLGEEEGESQLIEIIAVIINVLLSLLGVIFLLLLIYGGVLWMTSRGNEENVTKAKKILTDSIIGLIIILAAYAISRFVVDALVEATLAP